MKQKIYLSSLFLLMSQAYYGQSIAPQPFLREVIAEFPNVRDVTVDADGREVYFTAQSVLGELSVIMHCKMVNGKWGRAEIAPFSGKYHDLEPFLAPSGLSLYFASNRPLDNGEKAKEDYDIWYVVRPDEKSNWSQPMNMGIPVNSSENEFYPCVTVSGNLYFTSDGANSKGKDDIFVCKLNNGKYERPVSVSDSINTQGYEFNAFVSPDERFLIYTCYNRQGGIGSGDLYISMNRENKIWTTPIHLGKEINSAQMDYCPFYNPETGNLIFTSKRSLLNVTGDTRFNTETLATEFNKYSNGQSRLYQVNIKSIIEKLK